MRGEELTGFALHLRPLKETSKICEFFSVEHGVVSGAIRQSLPHFSLTQLRATGTSSLKSFTKAEPVPTHAYQLQGEQLYCGFYLNEILVKLMPKEEAHPSIYHCYQHSIRALSGALNPREVTLRLRMFELELLDNLGYGISFRTDANNNLIDPAGSYRYHPEQGWLVSKEINSTSAYSGLWIYSAQDSLHTCDLRTLSRLCRQVIDHHLDHKELSSRKLMQELRSF